MWYYHGNTTVIPINKNKIKNKNKKNIIVRMSLTQRAIVNGFLIK